MTVVDCANIHTQEGDRDRIMRGTAWTLSLTQCTSFNPTIVITNRTQAQAVLRAYNRVDPNRILSQDIGPSPSYFHDDRGQSR